MASICSEESLLGQCKVDDFEQIHHQWVLKHGKNAIYTTFIMEAILEYKMDIFYYIQSYYRCFMKGKDYSEYPVYDMERRKNDNN